MCLVEDTRNVAILNKVQMPGKYADQTNEKRNVLREITGYSTTSNEYGKHNNHPNMQNKYQKQKKGKKIKREISNAY